ncbi:MAG TPA: ABC transporter substrate-binding protein [Alphaproteobacteria bacterium]
MSISRRRFLAGAAGVAAAGAAAARPARAQSPIKVAGILDASGGLDIYGRPMIDCMRLAVEETNAAGGLLGRPVELLVYDAQSNIQFYTQFATEAATAERVAVVHGGITSASREAIRPLLRRYGTLYFYNTQYEGGVCDRNIFATGSTPAQTVARLVPHVIKRWGKRIYTLAADYNYGQITARWVRKFARDAGGEVVASDFFPLDVTDFGTTISKIQAAKPDMVVSVLVGGAHMSFYRQWAAAGMKDAIPLASTTFGVGNEHRVLSPAESAGIVACYGYFEELETVANRAFLARLRARYGAAAPAVNELAVRSYEGFLLWADGVRRAGTTDHDAVIEALESGVALDGPSGPIRIDAATHHIVQTVYLGEIKGGGFAVLDSFPDQPPADTAAVCDLIANPDDTTMYEIDIDV